MDKNQKKLLAAMILNVAALMISIAVMVIKATG